MTTKYWVLRPGAGMKLEDSEPISDDSRVVSIEQTEQKDTRGIQVVLRPTWKLSSQVTKHRGNHRAEARRLFEEFMDGKGGVIPPIDLALLVKGLAEGYHADPDLFTEDLQMYCVQAAPPDYKKFGGRWHQQEDRGTHGSHYVPVSLPGLWVVPFPGKGLVVYDETTAPKELSWAKRRQPEPWKSAIFCETCDEVDKAVKKLAGPFARKMYGNLAPVRTSAPAGSPNQRRRAWWRGLIRRI